MLKLNKKGQASSTFQLLIAAVVALAILGVLLSILNVIPGMNTKPGDATKTLLKSQMDRPGEEQCTTKVTFDTSSARLSAEAITTDTGSNADQVFFANPEELSQFEPSGTGGVENQLLKYNSTNTYKVIMCVICSNSKTGLGNAIVLNRRDGDTNITVPTSIQDNQVICVIYPRKTR